MRKFTIYHAVDPTFTSDFDQVREPAGVVTVESLERAFIVTQNINGSWNPLYPCRSTSIGDVIEDDEEGVKYVVAGIGFIEMPAND